MLDHFDLARETNEMRVHVLLLLLRCLLLLLSPVRAQMLLEEQSENLRR